MTTAYDQAHRLALIEAATTLAREAIAAAATCRLRSESWYFYRGVEDAALHVLRPELATVREGTSWLDAEDRWFRDGFLEAQMLLATAAGSPEPRMHLPMPAPKTQAS